jgi:hypothetical protein
MALPAGLDADFCVPASPGQPGPAPSQAAPDETQAYFGSGRTVADVRRSRAPDSPRVPSDRCIRPSPACDTLWFDLNVTLLE